MQLPPDGVYAVRVSLDGSVLSGVCNIGVRPTVDSSASHRTVEAHLFDLSKDLVGKVLGLVFVRFLRGERKFSGLEELKAQITCDSIAAREIL
jgi:riboflavin kinase/FMN adenylyltransferase